MFHVDHKFPEKPDHKESSQPQSASFLENEKTSGKLLGKVALITGGDHGLGRAIAMTYAKEGADVAFIYPSKAQEDDANITAEKIDDEGRNYLKICGDIREKDFCHDAVEQVMMRFGRLNILVNNATEQHTRKRLEDITEQQLMNTFSTNIFGAIFMAQSALPYMKKGDTIINIGSMAGQEDDEGSIDDNVTKGAIATFTRSLSADLMDNGIRVNAVAPEPTSFHLGQEQSMHDDITQCFVFLASSDSKTLTGEILSPENKLIRTA